MLPSSSWLTTALLQRWDKRESPGSNDAKAYQILNLFGNYLYFRNGPVVGREAFATVQTHGHFKYSFCLPWLGLQAYLR